MASLYGAGFGLILMCAIAHLTHSLTYSDLEETGISCPKRDKCRGYKNDLSYLDRNCECDSACHSYQDCCIDVRRRNSGQRVQPNDMKCLNYGDNTYAGIYVVSKCSNKWNGPKQVKQSCEGPPDMSDPVSAAPVQSLAEGVTYKNLFCAECNNADMNSIKVFHFKLSCEGVTGLSHEQIMDQLSYDKQINKWGVNRVESGGKPTFKECKIFFDLPENLAKNVRYCRANTISKCARDWTQPQVRNSCEDYMAVVYDRTSAYRNPHCAICNHKAIPNLVCSPDLLSRKRPLPFTALININDDEKDNPRCPAKQVYDPYFKRCRQLSCAKPGYVVENGKCVPGS